MAIQLGVATRNGMANSIETVIGTLPVLTLRSGAPPANCAAADTGTLIATLNLPSDWIGAAASGVVTKVGTWEDLSADNAGTIGHFRIKTSGAVCEMQGTAGQSVVLTTNALTAANGNVLNFAATTGVVVGMNISGTGVPAGATVVAVGGTTVTMSDTSTAGVSNGASITFAPDMVVDNATVTAGQQVTVTTFSYTRGNS